MNTFSPDTLVVNDDWSDLSQFLPVPEIDHDRLRRYRVERLRQATKRAGAAMCVLVSPISLRYAVEHRSYSLFQSHVPSSYVFVPVEGPLVAYGLYGADLAVDDIRAGRPLSFFDGGWDLAENARLLADDIVTFLSEIGTDNRRVAVEYVNPSLTQALLQRGLEVTDGVIVAEEARIIKSEDEIACMRWAIAVAELGMAKMREALRPGVSELQLWGLLNYTNLANNGDWHEGRMLASGPRINPWFQEAADRRIEAGDLVGFDTDMVGPFGYFADISRTYHCGPETPTARQKQLYRLAYDEITHNINLIRPGLAFEDLRRLAFQQDAEFHANAYPMLIHGVGMCDEYPRVNQLFRESTPYQGTLEAGMVVCVESYVGAVGERDGVKLEQQVLITDSGYEVLSMFPFEEALLD